MVESTVSEVFNNGPAECYKVIADNCVVSATANHEMFASFGKASVNKLRDTDLLLSSVDGVAISHSSIASIQNADVQNTIDLCVPPYHNFFVSDNQTKNWLKSSNSQKVLGTEGHWEVINEGTSNVEGDSLSAKDQLIRLYPTPKGAFPVVVMYVPVVNHFRSAQARMITYEMMEAEAMVAVGMARRKIQGMPTPDGGTITYDGAELVQEGQKAKEEILDRALKMGEPLGPHLW